MKTVLMLLIFTVSAGAKDVALILNDQRQQALYQAIDATVRAQGVQIAPQMLDLLNVLRSAPTVTEQPPVPPEPKKD